eukprot:m.10520 g.10520  ORF g.10520 m.10520 type:complete len:437 (+) comp4276_c0_seq1:91-1401(+)
MFSLLLSLVVSSTGKVPLPSPQQATHMKWGHEMFIHFSITTFTGSQDGNQDPTLFAPDNSTINVSQWVETAVKGGFPVATLTTKHEAGFSIWPTKFNSNYSILMSPTVGSRDLVQEFVTECRRQGILPGFYFTTGARTCDFDCQKGQITELATNYGDIAYWWFDHHGPDPTHEMFDQVVEANNPNAVRLGPDSWVTGDESGYASYPIYNQCNTTDGTKYGRCPTVDGGGSPYGTVFKSWECSCSDYTGCHPWFPGGQVMQLDDLMGKYESCWGRSTNLILNFPPEKNGLIASDMVASAAAFKAERERRYTTSVVAKVNSTLNAGDDGVVLDLSGLKTIDRILISEAAIIEQGQAVMRYTLEANTTNGEWVELQLNTNETACAAHEYQRCGGKTIGFHKVDVLDPPVVMSQLRLKIMETIEEGTKVPISIAAIATRH